MEAFLLFLALAYVPGILNELPKEGEALMQGEFRCKYLIFLIKILFMKMSGGK